jgi:hypothetical protein
MVAIMFEPYLEMGLAALLAGKIRDTLVSGPDQTDLYNAMLDCRPVTFQKKERGIVISIHGVIKRIQAYRYGNGCLVIFLMEDPQCPELTVIPGHKCSLAMGWLWSIEQTCYGDLQLCAWESTP